MVEKLLEGGVEIDAQGGHRGSALQTASAEGHEKIVQILLEKGSEVYA